MFGWWKRYRKRPRRPLLELYALEDRMLLDGTAFDGDALLATDLETIDIHSLVLVDGSESTPTAEGDASALPDALPDTSADQQSDQPLFADNAPSMRFEVIVLDTDLVDSDGIVRRIQEASTPNTSFVVYQLSPNNDGIHQLSAFLQGVSDVSSLHLVANQTDSVIRIGPTHLNAASLAGYAGDIAVWQSALTADAEIRFHGLAGASDEATFDLVESFSALLGHAVSVEGLDTQEFEQSDNASPPNEIVVLTSDLPDVGALVQAWQAGAGDDQHFTYLVLESTADGVEGITRFLADSVAPYSAIHIVSHGFEGGIQLGSTVLATATLDGYHNQLTSWQSSLTDDADILIYGCDVAAGEAGETFIKQLAVWTGADIAASDDKTGNTKLGGDWVLETQVGGIEHPFLPNEQGIGTWYGLLNIAPEDIGAGTQFVGDSSTVISELRTMPALDDFTLEITATPRSAINLPTPSNSGIIFPQTGGMAVLPEDGDSTYGTSGGVTRGIGIDIGTNGLVVYQHTSNLFSSLLTYSGSIAPDTDIAVVFTNKTPSLYLNGVLTVVGIQSDTVSLHPTVGSNASLGLGGGNTSDGGKYFTGTLSDYRIWDSALDEATINANRMMAIAPDAPGLLANMVPSSLAENSANGTLVATALGYDPDTGETFTYQLLDDAGGRFAIDFTNGQITVADGSLLNYEATSEHTIQIRVTDSQGATYDEWFTVALLDQPDAPIAQADSFTLISGVPIVIDPLANDSSSLGLPLAVTHIIDVADNNNLLALPTVGSSATLSSGTLITLRSDGRLDVTAAVDGQESFGYRLSDGDQTDDELVTLNVASDEATAQSIGLVTTWDTRKPGSASNTIVLPAAPGSSNYTIYWGDGTKTAGASGSLSHTYTTAGIKTITIVGDFAGFEFNNGGDRQKILTVEKWGNIAYTDLNNAFRGAVNLQVKATDTPDLSNVTSLERLFEGISNLSSDITGWDVSTITNMSYMFLNARTFNQNIGDWDVSHVTSMAGMFQGAWAFNQDISQWDTSNVTNMGAMFNDARGFNSDISGWDTSKVEHFGSMFFNADAFNRDIGRWDTSSATNMSNMFQEANAFNQDLLGWDVSKVTNMNYMFYRAWNFNGNISNWDTANVVSMVGMFNDAREFNQDLSQWNTEKVISFREMFLNAYKFNGNITAWSTGKVIDFSRMFYSAIVFNQDISGWDTSAALNMSQMFYDARLFNQNIGNWNVSKVTNMIGTFNRALAFNGDISGWDVSAVTRMDSLFNSATSFNQSITNWNIGNVTHMPGMFAYAHAFSHDITGWDVTGVVDMNSMFLGNQTFNQDISGWDTSTVSNMSQMFYDARAFNQDIGGWNTSNVTNMSSMFRSTLVFNQDLSAWDVGNVTTFREMFYSARDFNGSLTGWDTSSATDMYRMFRDATVFNQDISDWNTANVSNMSEMFLNARTFNQDLSNWNTAKVTTMAGMFQGALAFDQDIGGWDVSSVTRMENLFNGAKAFNQDINGWDVSKVTHMGFAFAYADAFTYSIGDWNTSAVVDMSGMFYINKTFNQDIGNWNTSNVTNMSNMFYDADAFNQDIGGWDTSKVTRMDSMFYSAAAFDQDIGGWNTASVTNMYRLLRETGQFNQDISGWNVANVTDMREMLTWSGLSPLNYNALLVGWSQQPVKSNINFGVHGLYYGASAEAARNTLLTTKNWTFSGDALGTPSAALDYAEAVEAGGISNAIAGSNPIGNVLANDYLTGFSSVTGVAAGNTVSATGAVDTPVAGQFGSLSISVDGTYVYTLDENNTTVHSLNMVDTALDVFTYTYTDGDGFERSSQLSITITGANDLPSDLITAGLSVDENSVNGTSVGTVSDVDIDGPMMVYHAEDFSSGAVGWTGGTVTNDLEGNPFLGQFAGSAGGQAVSKTFAITHAGDVHLVFDFLLIDSWEWEDFLVFVDDAPILTLNLHSNVPFGAPRSGVTGDVQWSAALVDGAPLNFAGIGTSDNRIRIELQVSQHVGSSIKLGFGSTTNEVVSNESYGIDNLLIAGNPLPAFSLVDDSNGRFAIHPATGELTVADTSLIDFESASSHDITVRLTDASGYTYDKSFAVAIGDTNDAPLANTDQAIATEAGGMFNGTPGANATGNVVANDIDPDAGDSKTVIGVDNGTVGSARGDVATGVVGLYGTITIAAEGTYTYIVDNSIAAVQALRTPTDTLTDVFTYSIEDADGASSSTQITVTIQGSNDTPHNLSTTGLTVAENAANGTSAGSVTHSDVDLGDGASFLLVDNAGDRFTIDSATGVVTVANRMLLDRESSATHQITVRVTDTAGAIYDQVLTVTVTDVDEFDVGAVTDSDSVVNIIAENSANGTVVGITALAYDTDATNNAVTYSLIDDGGRFAINSSTGVVTVAGAIDREVDGPVRLVTVIATSIDGSSSSRVFEINIRDLDEYDVTAPIDVDAAVNRINENAPIGTNTGIRLSAVDLDATNHSVSFSLDDSADGRFTIDPLTGVISVADSARLDYETTSAHTLLVRAHSEDGSSAISAFTIYLQDVGEVPIAVADYGVAVEAGGTENSSSSREAQGNVLDNDTDADLGDTKTIVGLALGGRLDATGLGNAVAHPSEFMVQGLYGTVSMSDDGGYVYTVDDSLEVVERLLFPANTLSEIFTYTFIDGSNQSATSQLEIIIRGSNDAPTGEDLQFTIYANEVLDSNGPSLLQNAFDIDNANLTTLVGRTPSSGKVTVNPDGSFVYTPAAGFFGSDSFTYVVSDGELTSNEHVVTIDVRAISMTIVMTKEASVPEVRTTSSADLSPESSSEEPGTDRATESLTHEIFISVNQLTNLVPDESLGDLQEPTPLANNSDSPPAFSFSPEPASEDQNATSSFPMDSISAKSIYQGEMNHSTVLRSIDFEAMMNDPNPVNDALRTIDWTAWAEESAISKSTPLLPDLGVGIVGASAGAISVGYVYWALRGGALAASCIGGVSAWRMLDVSSLLVNHHSRGSIDSRASGVNGRE